MASGASWDVDLAPSWEHEEWSNSSGALWGSAGWANVLAGLGCEPLFAWHRRARFGAVIPVFRYGALRATALGFPFITPARREQVTSAEIRELGQLARCSLVRVVNSCAAEPAPDGLVLPEAWADLERWPGARTRRLKKDLAFARRAAAGLTFVDGLFNAEDAWRLYRETVVRHGGRARYTIEYFGRLSKLADLDERLAARSVVDAAGRLRAFAVAARNEDVAYYLHAATDPSVRDRGVNDLLLANLFDVARGWGVSRFDLMASPANQPGLTRYKSKWATTEGYNITRDHAIGAIGHLAVWGAGLTQRRRS